MYNPLLTDRWFNIPENAKQHQTQINLLNHLNWAIDQNTLQNVVIAAGRRSFKTERFAKRWGVHQGLRNKLKILYGAPTIGQCKEIFWKDIKALINPIYIKKKYEWQSIELWNGTEIKLFGLKEYERVEGQMFDLCIISEWQQCEPEAYSQTLQPILNDTNGVFIFEGRPFGKNHHYDMYMKGVNKEKNWYSAHWSAEDILTEEQISAAKDTLSLIDYQREYQASFETGSATPYYAYTTGNHGKYKIDPNKPIIITCDFNATEKPMSWVLGQEDSNRHTFWTKAFQYQFTNTETMCSIVSDWLAEEFSDKTLDLKFYGDYAGKQNKSNSSYTDWEIIENHFRNYGSFEKRLKPCTSIRDSIGATNARLCNAHGVRRQFIDYDNCKPLATDWNKVEWKDNSREIIEKGLLGHLCRAVDYYNDYEFPVKGKPKVTHGYN